ncbi:MAG: 50S ribosomal protein L4 [Bdellovibrionaceae bacterium]|nr:50S ribosomal protein L4 [Pseudobdellovibrionaceae bacterium]|tara:strand:- start:1386 stop:2018 length:633 start_codon:yes stop_codon:yes gene_type:complete
MATLDVFSLENKKVGTVDLSDDVFATEVNVPLVHQVIKAQLAGRRQGTVKTKTKGEVSGGGKKPYKQKGTGNARQGSTRAAQFVGGGRAHGPKPRSYEQATPKEMVKGALRSALSDRVKANRLVVVDEFKLAEPKTKVMETVLSKFDAKKVLIVDENNRNLELSGRNLKEVKVLRSEGLNVYDVIRYDWLLISKKAVEGVSQRLTREKKA